MSSEQCKYSKNQQKQTSAFSDNLEEGMFQPRPFLVQSKKDEEEQQSKQVDLETSLMRAERYGHNLSKINSTSISSSQIVQPKFRMGNLPSINSSEANRPIIQSKNTENTSEVIQTARARTGQTKQTRTNTSRTRTPQKNSTSQTITQSGRISKPPQQSTSASTTNRVSKARIRRNNINAQRKKSSKQLQKLLDNLRQNPQQPYGHLQDSPNVGNLDFTAAQKRRIYAANMKKNGQLICDLTGQQLTRPQKSKKGVKPSPFEAQIDHFTPWSKGGTNSFGNALVLSRYANRFKSNN